ncbi:MAG TPA: ABC transporter permease [Longimicrobiales bacterium]
MRRGGGARREGGRPPGARLIRLLLRLYPAPFRAAYGEEMVAFIAGRLERARVRGGRIAALRAGLRAAADIVRTAVAERFEVRSSIQSKRKGDGPMSSMISDLRHAVRRLRATPLFTLSATAILAVGIGLNATVFSLVDTILLQPPPYEDPERIVHIYQDSDYGSPSSTSFPAYREMAAIEGVFSGVAATSSDGAVWETEAGPRNVSVEYATASYFPVLGLRPQRGRWFGPEHDRVGSAMVAVVSHRAWRTLLGGDPGVVGRTIRLNNQLVTIIGIGPADFNGEAGAVVTDFWLSISSTPVSGPYRVANLDRRQDHWYQVKARLAPGVTIEQAKVAMTGLARHLAETYPELNEGRGITVFAHDEVRLHPDVDGGLVTASAGMFALATLVLVLACSNLANLLLVRGISRGPELAVRQALGAGRGRVVRLLLFESLLLSALGGAAGLGLAAWSVRLVPGVPLPAPGGTLDVGFDHRVVVFGTLLALATGLVFGLLPALRSSRTDVAGALRDESRSQSTGRGVSLVRGGLVAVQVAVSLVLVVGAGLLTRSLTNAERVDAGVDVERIAVIGTNLRQGGVETGELPIVTRTLLERIEALPGVESAALTTRLPVQDGGTTTQVVDGYVPPSGTGAVEVPFAYVSRDYFETMGIRLVAGRGFTPDDRRGTPRVVLVNETAARVFWGGDALGGRIRPQGSSGAWMEVVGVVADVKVSDLREPPTPMVYYSADQVALGAFTIVARTAGAPAALTAGLRSALREVRPSLPVTRLGPLDAHLGETLAGLRAAAALLGAFSLLAIVLAGFGVYAVVTFTVERRARELGIRMALGAAPSRLVWTVVGRTLLVVAAGVVAGLAVAAFAMRVLDSLLFGVGSADGVTFTMAAALLAVAGGAAAFLPARRAARADPVEALRQS